MANEIRLRRNNIAGTITDNPLSNVATTINSPGFVDLPVVDTTNHLILILDPLEVNGTAEIVQVTAHSAASSSVTVVRGFEGSSARTHILGTTWFHGPVVSDWNYTQRTALSTRRPTSPFTGEMIYETDTKKLMVYNGTEWNPNQAGGQIGYAQVTANQNFTTAVDITGLTVTVIVGTNRRIRISSRSYLSSNVAGDSVGWTIFEDGVQVQFGDIHLPTVSRGDTRTTDVIRTPSVGSHTYKIQGSRTAGSGTITSNAAAGNPAYILVEDIGAA